MAIYRYNSIKFDRKNLRGLDADCVKGLTAFMVARERVLNTIETTSHLYTEGPFTGQMVELCDHGPGILPLDFNGWTGFYQSGKWTGTTGNKLAIPDSAGELKKTKDAGLGKGFDQLGDLLSQLGECPDEFTKETTIRKSGLAISGLMDDFGFSIEAPKRHLMTDDLGETFAPALLRVTDYSYSVPVIRAVYTMGRTTYKIKNSAKSIDRLRAAILAKKKWFADKFISAADHSEIIEPEELAHEEEKSLGQRFDEERARRKAAREAAAVQDVAQVVAQAVAAVAICDAMATTEEATTQELATCEAGDSEAQSPTMGNAGTWAPMPQYIPPSVAHINAGQPTPPAFRGIDQSSDCQKMAYSLPTESTYKDWSGSEGGEFMPNERQKMVIESVAVSLDEGLFYTVDVLARCIALLNIDPETQSINTTRVEGGEVGMDVYYARRHIEAKKAREASQATALEMNIRTGDKLGTLVFSDYKRTTGVTITGAAPGGFTFTGKRGAYTVSGTGTPEQFKNAMDRAFTKGNRGTDYAAFIALQAKRPELPASCMAGAPVVSQADKPDTPTPPAPPAADFAPAGDFGQPTAPEQTPTVPQSETPQDVADTLEAFEAGDGVSFELCEAINRATVAQVQGLTDAQFSKLYDHLENWNFHTENYLIEALRTGDCWIVSDMRQVMADQTEAGYLRGDIYDRRNAIAQRIRDAQKAQADATQQAQAAEASQAASNQTTEPKAYKFKPGAQVQIIRSKSQKWLAEFRAADGGLFELGFKRPEHHPARSTTYATARERMAALQAMARAADAPNDTPPPPAPTAPDFEPAGDLGKASTPEQTPTVPQSETPQDVGGDQAEAVGADFERVEPIRVDLAALIIKGVKPEELVGMGVYCSGDRANPSGSGAVTGFSHSDFYGLVVDVTLEDGRVWRAIRTISFKDGWFSLNAKMHGAPYLAELAMGATLAKSKKSSAEELAKQAHAQALIDLAAQFPQLKRAENTYAGGKLAAVNMRVLLKAAFKGVKFSVTSDYSKVNVNWTDGPTDAQVQAVIGRFDIGASDTQSDYFYTVETAFSQLFGGVQYLSTYRMETDSLIQEAINQVYTGKKVQPTVEDYRKAKGVFEWSSTDWQRRQVREALNTISKA